MTARYQGAAGTYRRALVKHYLRGTLMVAGSFARMAVVLALLA